MYGYIRILKPELKFREYDDYRACYCGLCEALHRQYGSLARCTISYDMTFLVLLLSGLYEPNEELQKRKAMFYLPGETAMALSIVEQILQGCNKRL